MILSIIGLAGLIALSLFLRREILLITSKRELFNALDVITESMDLKISKLDHFSNKLFALDELKKVFVFLDHRNPENNLVVDLNNVKECTIITKLLAVQLELVYNDLRKPSSSVVFYRKFIDPAIIRRHSAKKTRKWEKRLTKTVNRDTSRLQFA